MKSFLTSSKKMFLIVAISFISSCYFTASAQSTTTISRVAAVSNGTKTNIWVSDFPKKTSVVIMDNENNLLSIITTNDFGAAYISLPEDIKTAVFAKTLNGEIIVSNKAVIKNNPQEQTVVSTTNKDVNKA